MKPNLKLLMLLSVLAPSAFANVSITQNAGIKNYSFSVDGIKTAQKEIEGQVFQIANLIGVKGYEAVNYEVGSPEVPVIRFLVEANNASDINVTATPTKNLRTYSLTNTLKPSLESVPKIAGAHYKVVKGPQYRSFSSFPAQSFEITPAGSVRGRNQFLVTLNPVEYVGSENTLKIARSYSVNVKEIAQSKDTSAQPGIAFVVGDRFKNSPSLKKYIDLKKSTGFNTYVINTAPKVKAETVRSELQKLFKAQKDLQFAIIIGDASDVPGKTSNTISGLTDHFFSSIDTNDYAKDINGPDISVGRIAVANEDQLAAVFRKYTRYINGDFKTTNWLSSASFLATNDQWELAEGTHNYAIDTYTSQKGYEGNFPAARQVGGDKLYAITNRAENSDVMNSITKGRSIINYSGHGANTYWDAPRVDQGDVSSLDKTTSSLPFVISNACVTADYRVDESFAETWQRSEWGAIAYWGSMDSSYWDEDDILEKRMYDGIFTLSKKNFGEITDHALSELWKHYGGKNRSAYYWETYHVFGDPSINLRINN